MDVLIVDFYDSFTYNIAEVVHEFANNVEVISYESLSLSLLSSKHKQAVILGPGPGHPQEYLPKLESFMRAARARENIFVLGICLGHQLLMALAGLQIQRAKAPIHGQALSIRDFEGREFQVQFYNSLVCVGETEQFSLLKNEAGEILAARGQRCVSYQFHPDSAE